MGKAEKKFRKEARKVARQYAESFDTGKELFCQFVDTLDRKGKRQLIRAIKKGKVKELLQGANNG